jgi:hypothetical protein
MELVEFLLARIGEDEAVARAAVERNGATWSPHELHDGARITGTTEFGNPRSYRGDGELWDDEGALGMFTETAAHIARWDPARVLAECEAKRRLIAETLRFDTARTYEAFGAEAIYERLILTHLALPYADHPDYRQEWKP